MLWYFMLILSDFIWFYLILSCFIMFYRILIYFTVILYILCYFYLMVLNVFDFIHLWSLSKLLHGCSTVLMHWNDNDFWLGNDPGHGHGAWSSCVARGSCDSGWAPCPSLREGGFVWRFQQAGSWGPSICAVLAGCLMEGYAATRSSSPSCSAMHAFQRSHFLLWRTM